MARRKMRSRVRVGAFAGAAAAALLAFPGAASAAVTSTVANGDLVVSSDAGDAITITSVDVNGVRQVKVNGADPGTGPAASATIDSIVVTGDGGANNINLSGVNGTDFTALKSVAVDGRGGNDTINGSQLADTLDGGDGNDRIIGDDNPEKTDDVMSGQAGDDTMVWNPGDDDDINEGGDGNDTSEVNGGGKEKFEVAPAGNRVAFDRVQPDETFGAPFNVDISDDTENLDLNARDGEDIVNAAAGLEALKFALDIDGGDANDTIDGGDGADTLSGGNGDDRITGDDNPLETRDVARGDAGDDTMVWNGGDDDDLNDGGDGNDTAEVNGADAFGEQFTVKPSAMPGFVRVDRTGPTPPGIFNVEISGTTERLDLNAGGGNDTLTADPGFTSLALDVEGGDGEDSLDGGDAADLLSGGNGNDRLVGDDNPAGTQDNSRGDAGDDTMVWNPGDDDDINEGGEGNDTAEVNGGGKEKFEVAPAGNRVAFNRVQPNDTFGAPFSVDIGTTENLRLNAGDGDDRIVGKEGLAGLIASTFNGDDGNDSIRGTDGEDLLSGGKGFDVIRSRDDAADQVEGNGGFDVAFVDKRDTVRGVEIVLGGKLRVRHLGGKVIAVKGSMAVVRLQGVATRKVTGRVHLVRGGKSLGSVRYKVTRKPKNVRIKLNRRGLRLLARPPRKGLSVKLRIDARDTNGNGWRTSDSIKLKR
jgi:Ca2+-binding RTX toxin-like protein